MSVTMRGVQVLPKGQVRTFAAHAAPKGDLHHASLPKQSVKQTKLPNGLTIIALENYSPIARIGVFVRAGARMERPGQLGVTHAIRNAAGLSTTQSTHFGIVRNIDYLGGSLTASATRDDLIYTVEGHRDMIGNSIGYLGDTVTRAAFKPWELTDNQDRMKVERERMKANPSERLIELLHMAAFKGSLSRSVYTPKHMVGKHDHNLMMDFAKTNMVSSRTAVVGLGVEIERLVEEVQKRFDSNANPAPEVTPSKYIGGNIRRSTSHPGAYAAVVTESISSKNMKESLALSLFQSVLGGPSRVKYGKGNTSLLGVAAADGTKGDFSVNTLNIQYQDTGLFGFAVAGSSEDIDKIIRSIIKKMRDTSKGLKDSQLVTAKNQLKADLLMSLENRANLMDQLGIQALNGGTALLPENISEAVDSLSLTDVTSVVSKVMKGRLAIASMGNNHNVPYVEELQ